MFFRIQYIIPNHDFGERLFVLAKSPFSKKCYTCFKEIQGFDDDMTLDVDLVLQTHQKVYNQKVYLQNYFKKL